MRQLHVPCFLLLASVFSLFVTCGLERTKRTLESRFWVRSAALCPGPRRGTDGSPGMEQQLNIHGLIILDLLRLGAQTLLKGVQDDQQRIIIPLGFTPFHLLTFLPFHPQTFQSSQHLTFQPFHPLTFQPLTSKVFFPLEMSNTCKILSPKGKIFFDGGRFKEKLWKV